MHLRESECLALQAPTWEVCLSSMPGASPATPSRVNRIHTLGSVGSKYALEACRLPFTANGGGIRTWLTWGGSVSNWHLRNGNTVFYDQGRFDEWCVYVQGPTVAKHAPSDVDYFDVLSSVAGRHSNGHLRIYTFFLCLYDSTNEAIDPWVLRQIRDWTEDFGEDADALEQALVTIYFAMVAEENKRPESRWPLKKRVKKIGVRSPGPRS